MNITLIYLDTMRGKSHTPLGLAYVASALNCMNHTVDVIACETYHYDRGHIFKRIFNSDSKVFGITAMFHETDQVIEMVKYIRSIKKNAVVILGGILATTASEFAIRKTDIDIAVKGEAEKTIVDLIRCIEESPKNLDKVKGIVFKDSDGEIHDTGNGTIVENLSEIKWPFIDAFPHEKLMSQHFYPQDTGCIVADIITSRGCPYNCNFCYSVSKPRYREINDVICELKHMIGKYGVNTVTFMDETFVINKKRIESFCEGIIRNNIKITYSTTARANVITEELLKMLYDTGCRTLNIGLESGDQSMLDRMHKGTTVEQTKNAIEMTRRAGIFVEYPCMVGNIGETPESMKRTFEMLKSLAWGDFQWRIPFFCTPFPGTEIYNYAIERNIIRNVDDFYEKYKNMNRLSINLSDMKTDDFLKLYDEHVADLKNHYYNNLSKWRPTRI